MAEEISAAAVPAVSKPEVNFTFDTELASWHMPAKEWLTHNDKHWNGLATATLVFNPAGHILLVQRASHDSMPNLWEMPGGAVDPEDETILHGAARELWEEAGLVARRFTHLVTTVAAADAKVMGDVFTNGTGQRVFCRFAFVAEVDDCVAVKLDPNEHQAYVWATEDEVRAERKGEMQIPITTKPTKALILKGFALMKERLGS